MSDIIIDRLVDESVRLTKLTHPVFLASGVEVFLARLDQIDSIISGNKWFKLKYNLREALSIGAQGLLSFGGPHSNHLHALAAVGQRLNLPVTCVVRGELSPSLTPTLKDCVNWGAELVSVSRAEYKLRNQVDYRQKLKQKYPGFYLVPEGGSNHFAVQGVKEMITGLLLQKPGFDALLTPVGSAGTLAGCIESARQITDSSVKIPEIIGVSALKGAGRDLECRLEEMLHGEYDSFYDLWNDYHFGGFGKTKPELIEFIYGFYEQTGVYLDPVYTGKMLYAIVDQASQGRWRQGRRLLVLHTGGLQGARAIFGSGWGVN